MMSHQGSPQNRERNTPSLGVTMKLGKQEELSCLHYVSPTVEPVAEDAESNEHDEEGTVIESDVEGEDGQARYDGNMKDGVVLQSNSKDGKTNMTDAPVELLDQIKRLIQQEFGLMRCSSAVTQASDGYHDTFSQHGLETAPVALQNCNASSNKQAVILKDPPQGLSISSGQHTASFTKPKGLYNDENLPRQASTGLNRPHMVRFADDPGRSAVDDRWGLLIDSKGLPTSRLSQVLQGVAKYIMDEFMPQKSIVIPPEKMAAYYSLYRLESETYSWISIFKCRSRGWETGLEDMYQDLGCEYHLIQRDSTSRASVPALTMAGFSTWTTINILAYPDTEAKRLNHVFSELPVSTDEAVPGLLPKRLPRHLLPDRYDSKKRRLLDDVVRDFIRDFLPPSSSARGHSTAHHRSSSPSSEKRRTSSGAHNSPVKEKRRPLARTESSPGPRTSTLDDISERNHSSVHTSRNGRDSHRDSHSRARRDSPPSMPSLGRVERGQRGPVTTETQTYHLNKDHRTTSPKTSTSTPVGSRPSLDSRRLTFPMQSQSYRASSSLAPPRGDGQDRERGGYHPYTDRNLTSDYTPRTLPILDEDIVSQRSGVAGRSEVGIGSGDPGPTWDRYLTDRQGSSARRDVLDRSARGSV